MLQVLLCDPAALTAMVRLPQADQPLGVPSHAAAGLASELLLILSFIQSVLVLRATPAH